MFIVTLIVRTLVNVAVYGLLLFLPAWRWDWPRAWILLLLVFAGMLATRLWALRGRESLLRERGKAPIQAGQPFADKLLVVGFLIVFPAFIAFIPVDVFHLHLLAMPIAVVSFAGLLLFVLGWLVISLAFRENAFALAIVKPQDERGQTVVETGVYSVVRHPLYFGVILVTVGVALWLESYAAAILAIVPIGLLVLRVLVEEKFLLSRLRGYGDYRKRVEHRLFPLVW